MIMSIDREGVHATHCCAYHGCKYGNDGCPVVAGRVKQEYPCEDCCIDRAEIQRLADLDIGPPDVPPGYWEEMAEWMKITPSEVRQLRLDKQALLEALRSIAKYFESGNSVPVDRATIRRDSPEVQAIFTLIERIQ